MGNNTLHGVNLTGWLTLESWVTPELFAEAGALDEEALEASLHGDLFPVDYVIGHASYFLADFPTQFEDDYHITEADGGVYVEVEVLTAALSDGSVFSSPVFNPELQGGILNFVPSWYIGEEFDDSFILILDYDIPLYEAAQAKTTFESRNSPF